MDTGNGLHWIRQVDLLTLRLFLSAVELGQIARAAGREHLVPSAATKRIQDLEVLAGVKLLERNSKGVVPSAAGEVLARHARTIFATLETVRRDMSAFADGERGDIVVSSLRWVILPYLAQEVVAYSRSHPLVSVDLREQIGTPELLESLRQGGTDIAVFVTYPGQTLDDFDRTPFRSERLMAVLPAGHPLGKLPYVSFEDIVGEDFVGFAPDNAPMMQALHATAELLGREIRIKFNARSVEVAHRLVREGLGVTVLPTCAIPQDLQGVVTIPLHDAWAQRDITIATLRERPLKPAAAAFKSYLAELARL